MNQRNPQVDRNLQALLGKFRSVVSSLQDPQSVGRITIVRRIVFHPQLSQLPAKPVCICNDGVSLYDDLRATMLKRNGWNTKFSREYIQERLGFLLVDVFNSGSQATNDSKFKTLVAELDAYNIEHIAFVPVVGFSPSRRGLRIGNVTFTRMTSRRIDRIVRDRVAYLMTQSGFAGQEPSSLRSAYRLTFSEIQDKVCGEYRAIGDPNLVRHLAVRETQDAIEALTFGLLAVSPRQRGFIGLAGEVVPEDRMVLVIRTSDSAMTETNQAVRSVGQYQIDPLTRAKLRQTGIFTVSAILGKPESQRTHFERAILRALH